MERYLMKITKDDAAKFISHLDTMRTIIRALKRVNMPISYSNGFNPHAYVSVAAPLSLGISSIGEYVDLEFDSYVEENVIKEDLNKTLPLGIKVVDILHIREKKPAAMSIVNGAKYSIRMNHKIENLAKCKEYIENILLSKEIYKMKKTKKGMKEVDVRPLILSLKVMDFNSDDLELEAFIKSGSTGSLSIAILFDIIKDFSNNNIFGYPLAQRKNIYTFDKNSWVDLFTFYK